MSTVCVPPPTRPEVRTSSKRQPFAQNASPENASEDRKYLGFVLLLHLPFLLLLLWLLHQLNSN